MLQGKYRPVFEALYPCSSTKDHKLAFNLYFSKISLNETVIKGNLTFSVPFDDTVLVSDYSLLLKLIKITFFYLSILTSNECKYMLYI